MAGYETLLTFASEIVADSSVSPRFPEEREALAASLVRQWDSYERHAGLFTTDEQAWFELVEHPGGKLEVGMVRQPSACPAIMQTWDIDPDDLPIMVWKLNEMQEVVLLNRSRQRLRIRANPNAKALTVELLT